MNIKNHAIALLAVLGFSAVSAQADFLQGRELQDAKKGKKFYGDEPDVFYKENLGCGACIRGGFTYCMPSTVESPDISTFQLSPICCQNSTCVTNVLKYTWWSCSSSYIDPITAVTSFCPNDRNKCGDNHVSFTDVGQSYAVNMTLSPGESCTYKVHASKGLPKTKLNNDTTGIDCLFLEYDDDDLEDSRLLRGQKKPKAAGQVKKMPLDTKKTKAMQDNKPRPPIAKIFDPTEGDSRSFKGGAKKNADDTISKNRYQFSTCTNMIGVANDTLRMLQTINATTISVEFSTTDFSSAIFLGGALSATMISALVLLL